MCSVSGFIDFRRSDCTLDLNELASKLSSRTRLVAVGCASNIVGTINPVREICRMGRAAGAQIFLDAVHYAPHALPDVVEWDCDWLACSAYKFFGPHVGILWGRPELLKSLMPYKLRPVTESLPGRWMTGTQNFEGIAGAKAAAYAAVGDYEHRLISTLLTELASIPRIKIYGLTDPHRLHERTPTVSFVHERLSAIEIADRLGQHGLFVGHGNFYALQVSEAFGLEPQGVVRVGLMHYNTGSEIDRLLSALRNL